MSNIKIDKIIELNKKIKEIIREKYPEYFDKI